MTTPANLDAEVRSALAAAWDEGADFASPHGGGYLRSICACNPYRVSTSPNVDATETRDFGEFGVWEFDPPPRQGTTPSLEDLGMPSVASLAVQDNAACRTHDWVERGSDKAKRPQDAARFCRLCGLQEGAQTA